MTTGAFPLGTDPLASPADSLVQADINLNTTARATVLTGFQFQTINYNGTNYGDNPFYGLTINPAPLAPLTTKSNLISDTISEVGSKINVIRDVMFLLATQMNNVAVDYYLPMAMGLDEALGDWGS
jgi:hypothetical protein